MAQAIPHFPCHEIVFVVENGLKPEINKLIKEAFKLLFVVQIIANVK